MIRRGLFFYLLLCAYSISAQPSKQISELQNERLVTLAAIEKTNLLLKENTLTINNALNRLNLLGQQIDSRKKIILSLNQELNFLNEEIELKDMQIKTLEKDIKEKKQHYANSLRKMYLHKNNQDYLLFILSSKSFSQSFNRIMYIKEYSGWQKKKAEEIIKNQEIINQEKELLIANRSEKLNLINSRQSEENQLNKEEANKKAEVKKLEKNKKTLQDDLAKKQKQADALNRQIEKIIAEEIIISKQEAKSDNREIRKSDATKSFAMTENERTLSSSFATNKGKLPFPLKGTYHVVGHFGVHQHREFSKLQTKSNGIDIETTSGNEARAIFNGVVSRVFTFPGYNNAMLIRHGDYLTLYANLDQVLVKQGDRVSTGQPLGRIYTDKSNGNSTLLHFELWKEQTKLNPLVWIK